MQSSAILQKLQRVACEDRLYKILLDIFGPPEEGPREYIDQVKKLISVYETELWTLSDDDAFRRLQELIDEEACPTPKLKMLLDILKDYLRLDILKTAERGAMEVVLQEERRRVNDVADAEREAQEAKEKLRQQPSLDEDAKLRQQNLKVSAEEKFRMAFLVRAGLVDEADLLQTRDEQDEAQVEVELNDVEPTFLRGKIRRKTINYRAPLASEVFRNATPGARQAMKMRQSTQAANAQSEEMNSLKRAAMMQQQRNTDRKIIKARERRLETQRGGPQGQEITGDIVTDEVVAINPILDVDDGELQGGAAAVAAADEQAAFGKKGQRLPSWMKRMVGDKPSFGIRRQAQQSMAEQRRQLPIYDFRDQFLAHVESNSATVLVGETGSGKTTQIPQYLYEHGYSKSGIICCTQPRRVAAETLAHRVAEEFGCSCGAEVGYTVRFKDNTSSLTKIKYMTDGMLLREALIDDTFQRYSVIILDEAHERSINTDVLFGIVRKAIEKRPNLKVVVTSATLDTTKFCEFFGAKEPFFIKGRTYPVETYYLAEPTEDYVECAILTVMMIHLREAPGDVLVFFTGQEEIDNAGERLVQQMAALRKIALEEGKGAIPDMLVLPLTATMPDDVQSKIFEPTPEGCRKVVLATNVAETSITIGNLYYVVDSGFCKQNMYDPKTGVESLKIIPVSRAQANQRAGRAGRIGPGKCFRLYTEPQFETEMEATTVPEIQRSNLFNIVLQLKAVGIDDLINFNFMDPPPLETLVGALQKLRFLEALDDDGILTNLGRRLAQLPVDPSQGKTLLTAVDTGCAAPVLTIVSMLAVQRRGVFHRPRDRQEESDAKRRSFQQPEGDQLTLMAVYDRWIESGMSEDWCRAHFLKQRLLMEARDTREQLEDMLTRRGARPLNDFAAKDVSAIRKAITSGYFFHAAKRTNQDMYVTLSDRREVSLHPSSALREILPKYVIYDELHMTSREYMREVMSIDPSWLVELAPSYYTKPKPGRLTKEQMSERIMPTLKAWESGSSWRISKQRKKK